jgi:hypothetical protein
MGETFSSSGSISIEDARVFMNGKNGVNIGASNISLIGLFDTAENNSIDLSVGNNYLRPHRLSELYGMNYATFEGASSSVAREWVKSMDLSGYNASDAKYGNPSVNCEKIRISRDASWVAGYSTSLYPQESSVSQSNGCKSPQVFAHDSLDPENTLKIFRAQDISGIYFGDTSVISRAKNFDMTKPTSGSFQGNVIVAAGFPTANLRANRVSQGIVCVWRLATNSQTWQFDGALHLPTDTGGRNQFGWNVCISHDGQTIAVNRPQQNGSWNAIIYLFKRNSSLYNGSTPSASSILSNSTNGAAYGWQAAGTITLNADRDLGYTMCMNAAGTRIFLGCPHLGDSEFGYNTGSNGTATYIRNGLKGQNGHYFRNGFVRIYDYNSSNSSWSEIANLMQRAGTTTYNSNGGFYVTNSNLGDIGKSWITCNDSGSRFGVSCEQKGSMSNGIASVGVFYEQRTVSSSQVSSGEIEYSHFQTKSAGNSYWHLMQSAQSNLTFSNDVAASDHCYEPGQRKNGTTSREGVKSINWPLVLGYQLPYNDSVATLREITSATYNQDKDIVSPYDFNRSTLGPSIADCRMSPDGNYIWILENVWGKTKKNDSSSGSRYWDYIPFGLSKYQLHSSGKLEWVDTANMSHVSNFSNSDMNRTEYSVDGSLDYFYSFSPYSHREVLSRYSPTIVNGLLTWKLLSSSSTLLTHPNPNNSTIDYASMTEYFSTHSSTLNSRRVATFHWPTSADIAWSVATANSSSKDIFIVGKGTEDKDQDAGIYGFDVYNRTPLSSLSTNSKTYEHPGFTISSTADGNYDWIFVNQEADGTSISGHPKIAFAPLYCGTWALGESGGSIN